MLPWHNEGSATGLPQRIFDEGHAVIAEEHRFTVPEGVEQVSLGAHDAVNGTALAVEGIAVVTFEKVIVNLGQIRRRAHRVGQKAGVVIIRPHHAGDALGFPVLQVEVATIDSRGTLQGTEQDVVAIDDQRPQGLERRNSRLMAWCVGPAASRGHDRPAAGVQSSEGGPGIERHLARLAIVAHEECAGNPTDKEMQLQQLAAAVKFVAQQYASLEVIGLWLGTDWIVQELECIKP